MIPPIPSPTPYPPPQEVDARNILQQLKEDPLLDPSSSSAPPLIHSLPATHPDSQKEQTTATRGAAASEAAASASENTAVKEAAGRAGATEATGAAGPSAAAAGEADASADASAGVKDGTGHAIQGPPVEAGNQRGNFQDAAALTVNEAVRQIAYAVSDKRGLLRLQNLQRVCSPNQHHT